MLQSSNVAELIFKYLNSTISPEEVEILNNWRSEDPGNEILFSKCHEGSFLKSSLQRMTVYDEELGWDLILKKQNRGRPFLTNFHNYHWIKIFSSVAAIIAVIMLSIWIIQFKNSGHKRYDNVKTLAAKNDKLPGKEGAVLMLANGQQVLLDSVSNGILSVQAGVNLQKKDGQLIYGGETEQAEGLYNTMITPRGRQFTLKLSDGTKVWLNSASSIRFPVAFDKLSREVKITGEVYFEVASDLLENGKRKPFLVQASRGLSQVMTIEVLGTHFNVNAYEDENTLNTTLFEGSVHLRANDHFMNLKPGEQASIPMQGKPEFKIHNSVDIDQVIAWRNGRFEFDETELPVIMRQISRWYDVDIVYEQNPDNEKYGGAISKSVQLSDVLKMLEVNGVRFRLEGAKLYVKP